MFRELYFLRANFLGTMILIGGGVFRLVFLCDLDGFKVIFLFFDNKIWIYLLDVDLIVI